MSDTENTEIILITSYYHSKDDERQKEINDCLINNAKNPLIKSIHLLNDQIYDLSFIFSGCEKIVQVVVDDNKERLSFLYAISYANQHFHGKICMLANSDIYYDHTLSKLNTIPTQRWQTIFLAISRYNDNGKLQPGCAGSQDTWVFQSPTSFDPQTDCNFNFGVPACDHRIAHIFNENSYQVINPCYDIITHHLHASSVRNYSRCVEGLHLYINPSGLTPEKDMTRVIGSGYHSTYVSHHSSHENENAQCAPRKNRKIMDEK